MPTLREARVKRLLSMRQLAHLAGLSPTTVYLTESGQRLPQYATMRKLAEALGVDPEEIDEFRAAMDGALAGKGTVETRPRQTGPAGGEATSHVGGTAG